MAALFQCLDRFGAEAPNTRIELFETVIGGGSDALVQKQVDLAITLLLPPGFLGEPLMRMRFVPAAHPDHPLHRLGRDITLRDLRKHRHLVVRDSGAKRTATTSTVEVEQRWTMSNMSTSILAAREGYGFAWYPEEKIREELAAGTLKPLPLRDGERWGDIYLVHTDRDAAGPGTRRLAEIIREHVKKECEGRKD